MQEIPSQSYSPVKDRPAKFFKLGKEPFIFLGKVYNHQVREVPPKLDGEPAEDQRPSGGDLLRKLELEYHQEASARLENTLRVDHMYYPWQASKNYWSHSLTFSVSLMKRIL